MTTLTIQCNECKKTFHVREGRHTFEFHDDDYERKRQDGDVCDHVWEGGDYDITEVDYDDGL